MSTIELHGVVKRFGTTPVLHGVDLTVPDGSTTAILGASGSGKTTMLRLVAGFDRVSAGSVSIGGLVVDDDRRWVRAQDRGVGYVPQEGALFPHLTVARNIGFGLHRRDRSRVAELVEMVGLEGLERRYPHQLSGGQQQRVALARALAIRPRVVLLDEPFGSLDASLRAGLRRDVARILAEAGTTSVLVTHDQDEAMAVADQIAVLAAGRVVACSAPRDLYRHPPDLVAAVSVGEANVLVADLRGGRARCVLGDVALEAGCHPGSDGPGRLLLRPEQLVLSVGGDGPGAGAGSAGPTGGVRAVVADLQYHGHDALVRLTVPDVAGTVLLARVPGGLALVDGQEVHVEVQGAGRAWSEAVPGGVAGSAPEG